MSGSLAVQERTATSTVAKSGTETGTATTALRELFGELGDLKRTRSAGRTGTFAARAFSQAWAALCAGQSCDEVMRRTVAAALAAARLGDLDPTTLGTLGLTHETMMRVLGRAFDAVAVGVDPVLANDLRGSLGRPLQPGGAPPFVAALNAQPRAGATCPGKPRLLLEPPESHGEHCWAVAVFGVLLAPHYGADPNIVFLAGLAHHLHNASMPDSGFTGEMLLGDDLEAVCATATRLALDQLPPSLRKQVEAARAILPDAETPDGRAFHAADVIDRVLQLAQHLRVATVTMPMLLDEWHLVHAGPVKPFHDGVLAEFGLP